MTPCGKPRNHGDEIANAIYAERRSEYDPRAVLEWEAEHGDEKTRHEAIDALREWEEDDGGRGFMRWVLLMLVLVWCAIWWAI